MKEGDKLLDELRNLARRCRDTGLFCACVFYEPPWWYWVDYLRAERN